MTLRDFFRDIPRIKGILLLLAMIIAGFDGVVLAQVIASVTKFNSNSSLQDIFYLVICGAVSYSLVQLASVCVAFLTNNMIKQLNQKYKTALMRTICSPAGQKKNTSDTISLLTVDLKLIEEKYFTVILESFHYFFIGLVSLLYLVYLSPTVSLLFIVCSFFPIIPSFIFSKMLGRATEAYAHDNSQFIKSIKDFSQGYTVVLTYNAFPIFFRRTQEMTSKMENSLEALENRHAIVEVVSALLSWLSYIIPISVALFLVIQGWLNASVVIAIFLASDRVITPFRSLSESLRLLKSTEATRNKINSIISSDKEITTEFSEVLLNQPDIIFENITFGFKEPLFKNVSLTIPYGSKVLIKGVSGSGKTTLLDLIQGKLKPTLGRIIMTDNNYDRALVPHVMSRIQQEPYYFELNLRDNLLMGLDSIDDKELLSILTSLGLLKELGEGCLDYIYGEQGYQLSGGQKQRIEIARALLHNRKILLVDEGTSSIDKVSSRKIRELFLNLDITILEVAHNYSEDFTQIYSHCLEITDDNISFYAIDDSVKANNN